MRTSVHKSGGFPAAAPAAVVIESRGPVDALHRSVELVRGSWWRVCGISLPAFVIASIAGMVLQQRPHKRHRPRRPAPPHT
ncbi:hypothetical protein ACIBBB_12875 [Streptomyces sp. NPDC051217]|uniref:hypothetical protein n=1 Tax=Streptomyces sp. NPDC051217 TaxID=3365644 RepID=UPI003794ED22